MYLLGQIYYMYINYFFSICSFTMKYFCYFSYVMHRKNRKMATVICLATLAHLIVGLVGVCLTQVSTTLFPNFNQNLSANNVAI